MAPPGGNSVRLNGMGFRSVRVWQQLIVATENELEDHCDPSFLSHQKAGKALPGSHSASAQETMLVTDVGLGYVGWPTRAVAQPNKVREILRRHYEPGDGKNGGGGGRGGQSDKKNPFNPLFRHIRIRKI